MARSSSKSGADAMSDGPEGDRPPGPIERRVREDVAALMTAHPMGESLAEMAYGMARQLDRGAGLAAAAVNRELRASLLELSRLAVEDDDDFADELSRPVRQPPSD